MSQTDYRPIDKIVGIILAIMSACGFLCGGAIVLGLGALIASLGGALGTAFKGAGAPAEVGAGGLVVGGILAAAFLLIMTCYLLNIIGAIGVMKSRRWGFMLTAVLTGINAVAALSGATAYLDILPALAVCVYCILRLTGSLGPTPD